MTPTFTIRRTLAPVMLTFVIVAVACSSESPTPTAPVPTPTATLVPTPTPEPTSTPSPVPTVRPSPTATATATATATPSSTPTPAPTSTPTEVPTPTQTPLPTPDPRYGLIVSSDDARAYELFQFSDYIDYTANLSDVPDGARKILYISSVNPVPLGLIQSSATQAPGSVWYVLGEPNAHGKSVEDVLIGLHDTYEAIKQADPTALITSPSMLNFSFNCINCGGYHVGGDWIISFRTQYMDLFGEEPPIDIWAIDVFPLVWPGGSLPASEAFPTVRDDIVVQQIRDFRAWLDIWDGSRGKPIWVTEFGLHWGFEDWKFGDPGCDGPSPVGEYLADEVKAYLQRVYTWFEENSEEMNIERWFTFSTYKNIDICQLDSGNGLSLLDSSGSNGELTEVGRFFNDWSRGIR